MKSMIKIALVFVVLVANAYATPSKVNEEEYAKYDFVTILDNGVKRKVKVLQTESTQTQLKSTRSITKANNSGVIVAFTNTQTPSIDDFEKKYSLQLKTKLLIGYYIFYNLSSKSDVEVVEEIIENESSVKTVRPNWKMKMKTY